MENNNHCLLVTWDFTEVSKNAFLHAIQFSEIMNLPISLMHIVKDSSNIPKREEQLAEVSEQLATEHGIEAPSVIVKEGSIFETIRTTAEEIEASYVIMGTHGMKGSQKIFGSWALKVLAGSQIPFIVVSKPPENREYNNIVFPIDFKIQNKAKLKWVDLLGSYFKTKVHVVYPKNNDKALEAKTKANIGFCKKYLGDKNIDFEIFEINDYRNFSNHIINYSHSIDADLIIIMIQKDIGFPEYLLRPEEQYIIANKHNIPVLCINPRTDLMKYGYGGF